MHTDLTKPRSTGPSVGTSSRLKVWWLTAFGGFRVVQTVRRPRGIVLGRVLYETQWLLDRRGRRGAEGP